jgi:hypothetical protein
MPSRLNHVKVITPEPGVVDAFLRQVCDVPEGWPLGGATPLGPDAPLGAGGELPRSELTERRRVTGERGFIAGSPESRQFQIFEGKTAAFWAICISTRHVEDAHARAAARGVPCTPIEVADWNERDDIRFFFCVVGGLMFEVMRVEPKASLTDTTTSK